MKHAIKSIWLTMAVLAAVYGIAAPASAATVWTAAGPGTVTVASNGTTADAQVSYALSGSVVFSRQTWSFSTTATQAASVNLPYNYNGFHAWFRTLAFLEAFVTGPSGNTSITLFSGEVGGGFNLNGNITLNVQPGDTYGFRFGGSNYDSDSRLLGTLKIFMLDTTPPVVTPPGAVTVEATGPLTGVGIGTATATDAVGVVSLTNNAPGSFPVGTTVVTWTARDAAGNTGTAAQLVTVRDTTAPVVTAPANTGTEATGTQTSVATGTATATDAVGVVSISSNAPATFPLGTTTVVWTARDAAGNTGTATQLVTVRDTTPPAISAPTAVTAEATSAHGAVVMLTAPSATDLVSPSVSVVGVPASGSTFPLGTTTVTWVATDTYGNSSTTTQLVTVRDTTPPVVILSASATVTVECHLGSYTEAGATALDIYDGPVAVVISGSVDADTPGTYILTYTSTDSQGNTDSITRTVAVVDTTPPVVLLNGLAAMTLECHVHTYSETASASDACDANLVLVISGSVDVHAPGIYTLTYTATDASGNSALATRVVTVVDTHPPTIALVGAAELTLESHVDSYSEEGATASDECDGDLSGIIVLTGSVDVDVPGTYVLIYSVTDDAGYSASVTRTVLVVDTIAPVVTAPAAVQVEASGVLTPVAIGAASATDLVGVVSLVSDTPATFAVGVTTVTWTAADAAGNVGTAAQLVTVTDTTAPVITAPVDVIAEATGLQTVVVIGAATATDLVGPVVISNNAPASFALGTTVVTWTATDYYGNHSSATQQVLVRDTTAPVVTAPAAITIEATGPQTVVVLGTATATDAIGVVSITSNTPATFPVGTTVVTWTAADAAGNSGSATQQVLVKDTTAPVVTAALTAISRSRDDDEDEDGNFYRVTATAVDLVDPNPVVSAFITQPLTPSSSMTVSYKKAKKNRIHITPEKRRLQVKLEGPSESALRALWTQVLANGGFSVSDGQEVQLAVKKDKKDEYEAKYQFDQTLKLTSAKGPGLKLAVWATDAAGNVSPRVEVVPGRRARSDRDDRDDRDDDDRHAKLVSSLPASFGLEANYPNPFNPSTTLRYNLVEAGQVQLTVYNVMGQQVRVLVDQLQQAGAYQLEWDSRDQAGQAVAPGLYLYRLVSGNQTAVGKMLLVK